MYYNTYVSHETYFINHRRTTMKILNNETNRKIIENHIFLKYRNTGCEILLENHLHSVLDNRTDINNFDFNEPLNFLTNFLGVPSEIAQMAIKDLKGIMDLESDFFKEIEGLEIA